MKRVDGDNKREVVALMSIGACGADFPRLGEIKSPNPRRPALLLGDDDLSIKHRGDLLSRSSSLPPHTHPFLTIFSNLSLLWASLTIDLLTVTNFIFPLIPSRFPAHSTMSDTIQELADIPRDFLRDGMLFVRRCTKRRFIFDRASATSLI